MSASSDSCCVGTAGRSRALEVKVGSNARPSGGRTNWRKKKADSSSLLFIILTAAVICGGGFHRQVFMFCNINCCREERGKRERTRVSAECWVMSELILFTFGWTVPLNPNWRQLKVTCCKETDYNTAINKCPLFIQLDICVTVAWWWGASPSIFHHITFIPTLKASVWSQMLLLYYCACIRFNVQCAAVCSSLTLFASTESQQSSLCCASCWLPEADRK